MADSNAKLVARVGSLQTQALGHALAGAISGGLTLLAIYPADTYKTRRVVSQKSFGQIVKEEGITSLYAGLGIGLTSYSLSQFVFYFVYSAMKSRFKSLTGKHMSTSVYYSILVGFVSGNITQLFTLPLNTIHTRLQSYRCQSIASRDMSTKQPSALEVVTEIVRSDGITGLWKGLPTASVLCINPSLTFLVFERLKHQLKVAGVPMTGFLIFQLGAVSKVIATIITYPLIVAKTQMQAVTARDRQKGKGYSSLADFVVKRVKAEGLAGLYTGLRAKCMQVALNSALSFSLKDFCVKYVFGALLLLPGVERDVIRALPGDDIYSYWDSESTNWQWLFYESRARAAVDSALGTAVDTDTKVATQ